ncbi:MAG: helix-turn-helix domain-containing protein [Pirellulaceae bacterium]
MESITRRHLPPDVLQCGSCRNASQPMTFHEAKDRVVEDFERAFLPANLRACGGIVSRAAERSGLSERNFHVKLWKYGIRSLPWREVKGCGRVS